MNVSYYSLSLPFSISAFVLRCQRGQHAHATCVGVICLLFCVIYHTFPSEKDNNCEKVTLYFCPFTYLPLPPIRLSLLHRKNSNVPRFSEGMPSCQVERTSKLNVCSSIRLSQKILLIFNDEGGNFS